MLKALDPGLSPAEIKRILKETGDPLVTDRPLGGNACAPNRAELTGCRLNAFRAVNAVSRGRLVFSNFGPGDTYDDIGHGLSTDGARGLAMLFVIPAGGDVALDRIDVAITHLSGADDLVVQVRTDVSGLAGAVLESFRLINATDPLKSVSSIVRPLLNAGGRYWVSVVLPDPTTVAKWHLALPLDFAPDSVAFCCQPAPNEWGIIPGVPRGVFRIVGTGGTP